MTGRKRGNFLPWKLLGVVLFMSPSAVPGAEPLDSPAAIVAPTGPASEDSGPRGATASIPATRTASAAETQLPLLLPPAPTILDPAIRPIDLNTALQLAGVQNPDLLIARQRVVEAAALRQLAAAQFLPSINLGMNYDTHTGPVQQSNGNILSVNRSSIYVGAGANAIGAGTVNIPGVVLSGNVATVVYGYLASKQVVRQREFASLAVRNQAFLQTTLAYCGLMRGEGTRAVAMQVRDDARRVAHLTAAYAAAGQGRKADADRAATELAKRESDFLAAEGDVLTSSARLCEVLNVDPSIRLHPTDAWVTPQPIVPDPIPVSQLIALALLQRPELGERRAAIRETLLMLEGSKVLPFSPTILVGFSAGGMGGGSNLVRPVFGGFGGRTDLDAYAFWTIQNLGVGNMAMINLARSRVGITRYQEVAVLDRIRAEVAEAYARTHARYAQIGTTEQAVRSGTEGFRADLVRLESTVGLPIELLDSMRLLARARYEYLAAIVDYNEAQFALYVALGQPPANALARPVPTAGVVPTGDPIPTPANPEGQPRPEPLPNRPANGVTLAPTAANSRPPGLPPTQAGR
ncbi:Outer membrane protein TolC [Singulisphaera sp. GP187]|uniref:TolC family protein n=1 Tax=Singulisphaera sp. GP187 TaxID=1882752 RepID=UPI00092BAB63|nr:TolC family protein [Singulisphaera sp. GP187]SIO61221.1 Outer membrane protein TolC [Singulisphaera sp. GP187]